MNWAGVNTPTFMQCTDRVVGHTTSWPGGGGTGMIIIKLANPLI